MTYLKNIDANLATNDLGKDAWGRPKTIQDRSILHGMFTYNIPVSKWYEKINTVESTTFTNCSTDDGKLVVNSGATLNDTTILRSFRNPRYQPNRGHLYSASLFLPSPTANGERRFGMFTEESGAFFYLTSAGVLNAVVRTTIGGVTTDDEYVIDTTGIDLSKGNTYDIQFQWRGVGGYKFFINLNEVKHIDYLGTRTELSCFNPANPIAFESKNTGAAVEIHCGCVDVSSEGGDDNGKTYGSIDIDNTVGQVEIPNTGGLYNVPILAIRSKKTIGTLINTRDTLATVLNAYSDQRSFVRVWITRDWTAITENDQSWADFGDGHLEYITYDVPDITTPMSFDIAKAVKQFGARVNQDETLVTPALFDGKTEIWITPGDMLVFTMHRETGGGANVGLTFEFAEEI